MGEVGLEFQTRLEEGDVMTAEYVFKRPTPAVARHRIEHVIAKLREVESCAAAKIEAQTCDACITAKWAGRELRRILDGKVKS